MAEELERNGDKAIVDEDYDQAVTLYTQAIDLDPNNSSLYASRAAAHIKLQNYTDAVSDSNQAIGLNPKLAKAHLRKGTACFYLEEYQTAKAAFEKGVAVDPNNSQLKLWIRKCDAELIEEAAADKQDGEAVPANGASAPMEIGMESSVSELKTVETANGVAHGGQDSAECSTPAVPAPQLPPLTKYRHEWYQTQTHAVVTVFAKGIKPEELQVEFGEQILSVEIKRPGEESYCLQLRLFGKIKPLESKFNILSTKVEIRAAKADTIQWKGLEYNPTLALVQAPTAPVVSAKTVVKKPAKDWDKLEAEVKKAEKDEKLDGDAALNKLFQDIYRNADEDTRRAMNKSFVESNGTVLSTNWKEVGSKNIQGSPPKGMEMKKWEH